MWSKSQKTRNKVDLCSSRECKTWSSKKYVNKSLFYKYLKRGLRIFGYGLIITAVTWIVIGQGFIIFGILHFVGIAIILEYPFYKRKYTNLILGLFFIAAGIYLMNFNFNFYELLWLGFTPNNFYTLDYFPLLPWLGVVSLGIFIEWTLSVPSSDLRKIESIWIDEPCYAFSRHVRVKVGLSGVEN